jgi:glycosyltransferase involved in cell wall biosynthesis
MAKAVRRVLTEEGLADRLSCNARRKVEQYDWSNVLPKWEKVLDRVTIKH